MPAPSPAAPSPPDDGAHAAAVAKKSKRLSAKQRARIRSQLRQQLRRRPASALTKRFLRQAALVDFKLPLTVRLNRAPGADGPEASDDQIEITWDDSVVPWPLAPMGAPAGPQLVDLSGSFAVEASPADSEGYGELGAMETILGGGIDMAATPFTISEFAAPCLSNPQLRMSSPSVAVTGAGPKYGLMNLFSGDFRGSLALRMTFASEVFGTCGGPADPTPTVDNSAAIPMPLRFQGNIRVSPALTADGKMRLGVFEVDDTVTPQTSTFAYVRSCTGTITCDAMQFPARIKLKKLRAEVLVGNAMP